MGTECVSGFKMAEGDVIKEYTILKTFDPGAFAFAGKARSPSGRIVFFKKYKRPGAASCWYDGFVSYQTELKQRIQSNDASKKLCYEFIEFFELKMPGGPVPKRAFYQVFEWVEGGTDLRGVVEKLRTDPNTFSWEQRVIFARVMMAGINAVHKADIIHTDLKPENFYLVPVDTAAKYALRVIDMDFSLIDGKQAPWHGHEGYVGTPGYMSPEHMATNMVPLKASDVFTCGLILCELLGGGHPSGDNMEAYNDRAKTGGMRRIVLQKPIKEAPDSDFVLHVMNAALRPEPSKRPTAEQLLRALSGQLPEFDGKRPQSATAVPAAPPPTTSRSPMPVSTPPPMRPEPPAAANPPPRPTAASSAAIVVEIVGTAGQRLTVSLPGTFGKSNFRTWNPDCDRFMAAEQFRLFKDAAGHWMIEHCPGKDANPTTANGTPITVPVAVTSGMVLALGRTGKCPITLNLK